MSIFFAFYCQKSQVVIMDFVIFQSTKYHYKMDIQTWCVATGFKEGKIFFVLLESLLLLTSRSPGINIQFVHSVNQNHKLNASYLLHLKLPVQTQKSIIFKHRFLKLTTIAFKRQQKIFCKCHITFQRGMKYIQQNNLLRLDSEKSSSTDKSCYYHLTDVLHLSPVSYIFSETLSLMPQLSTSTLHNKWFFSLNVCSD